MSYQSALKFSKVYIPNLNMILDAEEPMVLFVFSFENSPSCLKSLKNIIKWVFLTHTIH